MTTAAAPALSYKVSQAAPPLCQLSASMELIKLCQD